MEKSPPTIVIEVGGLGYEIDAPMTTICQLPDMGEEVTLLTHLVVRDDAHLLYGFASADERRLFRALLKVSGVGAKLALVILSGMDPHEFASCMNAGDTVRLTRLPGIGKKTAERLIVELRDRVNSWDLAATSITGSATAVTVADPINDAVSGLISLGYKPQEASRHVQKIDTDGLSSENIIRQALKSLVRG